MTFNLFSFTFKEASVPNVTSESVVKGIMLAGWLGVILISAFLTLFFGYVSWIELGDWYVGVVPAVATTRHVPLFIGIFFFIGAAVSAKICFDMVCMDRSIFRSQ